MCEVKLVTPIPLVGALRFAGEDTCLNNQSLSAVSSSLAICCRPLAQRRRFIHCIVIWGLQLMILLLLFRGCGLRPTSPQPAPLQSVRFYRFAPRWVLVEINRHAVTSQSIVITARLPGNQRSRVGFVDVAQNCAAWVGFTMVTAHPPLHYFRTLSEYILLKELP